CRDRKGDVFDQRALAQSDGEVFNSEGVLCHHAHSLCGSKASRTASPINTSRLSITAMTVKPASPSQGACRLFLPCASSSPSEGEPGGRPKPRKSSEVRVVIAPLSIKGRKVKVETSAFGSTWRRM